MVRDCLNTSFPHVVVGVLLHMHTCTPRFYIPVTAWPIVFKLSVRLGTAWATTALPCIFRNAWATRLGPGERCGILFRSVWNRAYAPRHFKQAAAPTRTTSRLIPASRDTARPWAMAPFRPGVPPVGRQPVAWAGELLALRADRPTQ